MNRRFVLASGLAAFVASVVLACAQGNEPNPAPVNDSPSFDAGSDTTTLPPDATVDAGDAELPRCSADDWCYTDLPSPESFDAGGPAVNPSPVVLPLSSVWVSADHRAWSGDGLGRVLLWDGSRWRGVFVAPSSVRSIWGTSSTDVWLAGDFGILHGTGDRPDALAFTAIATPTARPITRIWGTGPSDIWILSDGTNGVFHLTVETANDASPFAPVALPGGDTDAGTSRILTAVWGTAADTWLGGMEYQSCAPPDCTSQSSVIAFERTAGSDGWTPTTMPVPSVTGVISGVSTAQGQLLALQGTQLNTALAARITNGTWTSELVEDYGQGRSMWGQKSDDVWLVGFFGVVRHFDGTKWQVSRVTRSPYLPLVNHLNAIDAFVEPSGEQDMWIVGNDVALHRTVKP